MKVRFSRWLAGAGLGLAMASLFVWSGSQAEDKKEEDAAVARTRKQVQVLDDVYKAAVVLITEHYVNDADDLPAGSAAIALFDAIKKKGHHEVRLLDATGEPLEDKNVAKDAFEKAAIAALKGGKPYYDQVIEKDGKRYLRAATPIPVVLKKCTMCHPNYENAKPGEPIGALGYTVPIE
ncbi:MAG TPA: DUF3365 domain-containing protein [Pirellulaceae bacterium]|nr:DUF3365 domain-containing protein [Pirellulaceae bacterium]